MEMRKMSSAKQPRAYSVNEFCDIYAIGRSLAYELIAAGAIKAHKLGAKTVIFHDDAEEWLRTLPAIKPSAWPSRVERQAQVAERRAKSEERQPQDIDA